MNVSRRINFSAHKRYPTAEGFIRAHIMHAQPCSKKMLIHPLYYTISYRGTRGWDVDAIEHVRHYTYREMREFIAARALKQAA